MCMSYTQKVMWTILLISSSAFAMEKGIIDSEESSRKHSNQSTTSDEKEELDPKKIQELEKIFDNKHFSANDYISKLLKKNPDYAGKAKTFAQFCFRQELESPYAVKHMFLRGILPFCGWGPENSPMKEIDLITGREYLVTTIQKLEKEDRLPYLDLFLQLLEKQENSILPLGRIVTCAYSKLKSAKEVIDNPAQHQLNEGKMKEFDQKESTPRENI